MDLISTQAVTPVSPSLQSTTNRISQAAMGPTGSTAALPVVAAPVSASTQPLPDPQTRIEAIAAQLQDYLRSSQRDVEFSVDADTGAQVVTVRDAVTGEIVRQMPSAEVLRVLKNLSEGQGTLLDHTV